MLAFVSPCPQVNQARASCLARLLICCSSPYVSGHHETSYILVDQPSGNILFYLCYILKASTQARRLLADRTYSIVIISWSKQLSRQMVPSFTRSRTALVIWLYHNSWCSHGILRWQFTRYVLVLCLNDHRTIMSTLNLWETADVIDWPKSGHECRWTYMLYSGLTGISASSDQRGQLSYWVTRVVLAISHILWLHSYLGFVGVSGVRWVANI